MEEKEIREWRDRLIKMFGIYHSDGQEYVTCPLCGINIDELAGHIIKELSKAREEGRKELVKEIRKAIDKDMDIVDTEDRHSTIDTDIVRILDDKEITKMYMVNCDDDDPLKYGGWGWYS